MQAGESILIASFTYKKILSLFWAHCTEGDTTVGYDLLEISISIKLSNSFLSFAAVV